MGTSDELIYKGCDGAAQKQTAENMSTSVAIDFSSSRAYQAKSKTKNKFHNSTVRTHTHTHSHIYLQLITTSSHVGPFDSLPALWLCDLAVDCVLPSSASVALIFHTPHSHSHRHACCSHIHTHAQKVDTISKYFRFVFLKLFSLLLWIHWRRDAITYTHTHSTENIV